MEGWCGAPSNSATWRSSFWEAVQAAGVRRSGAHGRDKRGVVDGMMSVWVAGLRGRLWFVRRPGRRRGRSWSHEEGIDWPVPPWRLGVGVDLAQATTTVVWDGTTPSVLHDERREGDEVAR